MVVTHQALSKDEKNIHKILEVMASSAGHSLQQSLDAFMELNSDLAASVIMDDQKINDLYQQVEEQCFITIALRQPVANDLRDLLSSMHIASEIERIGDYAADIARKVQDMETVPDKRFRDQFQLMSDLCLDMLDRVMAIYKKPDEEDARILAAEDDKVDEAETTLVHSLKEHMRSSPDHVDTCVHAISVAHKLERIADRVTNIAERIVFASSGEMVELG